MITIYPKAFDKVNSDTNALTESVVLLAKNQGYHAWRQNNIAIPNRRFIGLKGVPDIIGFHKTTGMFLAIEIKRGRDKMSKAQKEFFSIAENSKCLCGVVKKYEDALDLFVIEYKYT